MLLKNFEVNEIIYIEGLRSYLLKIKIIILKEIFLFLKCINKYNYGCFWSVSFRMFLNMFWFCG